MSTLTARAPDSIPSRNLSRSPKSKPASTGRLDPRRLIDAAIRACAGVCERGTIATEWAFIDTRDCDAGMYLIREWTDAEGNTHSLERPPSKRYGGAIGLFTLHADCASVGPCPTGVDEGAGLLLVGFASMLAVPLPDDSTRRFGANWLVIMSGRTNAFRDAELDRIVLLTYALLSDASLSERYERKESTRLRLHSSALAASHPPARSR